MELILAALGLGLAGIDILGVVVITTALSVGASKRSVVLFALTTLIATVIIGVVFSLLLDTSVARISQFVDTLPDYVWVIVNALFAGVLLTWVTARIFKKTPRVKKTETSRVTKWIKSSLFIVGIFFAVSALADPSFLALIAVSAQNDSFLLVITANILWILISQAPLFALAIAVLFNKHKPLLKWFERVKITYAKQLHVALTILILMCALLLIADLVAFFVSNNWLL